MSSDRYLYAGCGFLTYWSNIGTDHGRDVEGLIKFGIETPQEQTRRLELGHIFNEHDANGTIGSFAGLRELQNLHGQMAQRLRCVELGASKIKFMPQLVQNGHLDF